MTKRGTSPSAAPVVVDDRWFVDDDEVVRLELPGGQWIEVRRELDAGSDARVALACVRRVRSDGDETTFEPDLELQRFVRLQSWIVRWSLIDPRTGEPAPVTLDSLRALRASRLKLIADAIDKHEDEVKASEENPTGGSASRSIST